MARRRKQGDPGVAIGYVRVSTDKQDLGPQAQRHEIDAWCRREGVQLAACFVDKGASGATPLDKREGFLDALDALKAHNAGVLVVARRDRLARDVVIAATAGRLTETAGARLVSADGVANDDTPEAGLMRTILDGFAQYERACIRSRTRAALRAKRRAGFKTGYVPYGLVATAEGRLVPHEGEQRVIALVKRYREAGLSLRAIGARLEAAGLKPRSGAQWHPKVVASIAEAA